MESSGAERARGTESQGASYNGLCRRGEGMLKRRDDKAGRLADAIAAVAVDLVQCLRFYSRLPVPALIWETDPHQLPDFRRMTPVVPLAGAIIGLGPALILAAALRLGLGPWLSAALSVAAITLVTGAFHEDGLADTA